MSEFKEHSIPLEYARERPHVFETEAGWGLVRNFALHYGELKPEVKTQDIASSIDLIRKIENGVAEKVDAVLSEILQEQDVVEEDRRTFLETAKNRSFAKMDFTDKEKVITALGLAMVAEGARTRTMIETLNGMKEKELAVLGMTPDQRDVVSELLKVLNAANSEYIRFKARAMRGEKFPERPVDALREESRIAKGIGKIREGLIAKGPENIFGEAGQDFIDYLALYERGYKPLSERGGQLISKRWKETKATRYRDAFEEFIQKHPDFPLILFPRGDEYVSDASGLKLGRDPEIRIAWQSPELKEEAERLIEVREGFIRYLENNFGDLLEQHDIERIRKNKPIIANDLGYFGIGMQVRFEAQELEGTSIIFENVQRENRASMRKTIAEIFGDRADQIEDDARFIELSNAEMMMHEWGHQVHHPENTEGAKNLGKAEDGINEMKSDLLSYSALHEVFGRRAEELYGNRSEEVLNMYILGYALDAARVMSPDSEERPYYMGAIAILNRLEETGVHTAEGWHLNANWSKEIFESQARELVELYHKAEGAPAEELRGIRKQAQKLGEQATNPEVEKLIKKAA